MVLDIDVLEVMFDKLQPHLGNVIEYMLRANKDANDEVALEACEFWYVLCAIVLCHVLMDFRIRCLVKLYFCNQLCAFCLKLWK